MHLGRTAHNGLPQRVDVLLRHLNAFQPGICDNRSRVIAHHTAAVSGAGPFGQESALAVCVGKALLHLLVHRGIGKVQQREQAAERVPETCVREHITRENLAVVGAIVHGLSGGVELVEATGEQHRTVQAGVESAQTVQVIVLYLEASKHVVPAVTALFLDALEVAVAQFLHVALSLFGADERGCNARVDHLALVRAETYDCTGMVALHRLTFLHDLAVVQHRCGVGDRGIEHYLEIIAEIVGHAAAVLGGIAHNLVFRRNHLDVRAVVHGVDHHVAFVVGECEAHCGCTVRRRHFGHHVMVGQVHAVIIWSGRLGLVREPGGTFVLIEDGGSGHRHDGELSVVVDPGTGLMRLLDAADLVGVVGVCPAVAHLAGLRRPEIHAPGHGRGGICVARREGMFRLRAHQRADIIHRTACPVSGAIRSRTCQYGCSHYRRDFHDVFCWHSVFVYVVFIVSRYL